MFHDLQRAFITVGLLTLLGQPAVAETFKLQKFKSPEQGQRLLNQFDYALASIDRGNPKEAQKVLEDVLPSISYDRRLFGYTRIAVTYFQLGKMDDGRAIVQKIVTSLRGENNEILNKVKLVVAFMKAEKFKRADNLLQEISYDCGPDRKNLLREINIARATVAVMQYEEATVQMERVLHLLQSENKEDVDEFEFSLDAQILDAIAGTDAH